MALKDQIAEDVKVAMRARDTARLSTLRLLSSEIKRREVDDRIELDDAQVVAVIEKMIKQRRDAASQMDAGGRPELADKERAEIVVLEAYRPAQLDASAILAIVDAAIQETGASRPADMGKLMAAVKQKVAGQADMAEVSKLVKQRLADQA